jgi:glycosyltransferase involved in cell wall biosynthesis
VIDIAARLRVLQVVPSYYPATIYGGPVFSVHYACQALARQGVQIQVATTNANGDGKLDVPTNRSIAFEQNYYVRYYDDTIINRFSWAFTHNLSRDMQNCDIVHLHDVFSTHAGWTFILAALLRKPLLVSARGALAPWGLSAKRLLLKKTWLELLVRPLAGKSRRVAWHATAESECREILSVLPKTKVVIIPNCIDCSAFTFARETARNDYFQRFFSHSKVAPENARILVGLGRLNAKKAFDVAIRALHVIAQTVPGAVLLVGGADDGEGVGLAQLIAKLGLEGRVALVGELRGPDKITFLKGADLFLFPSHNENFGMVALEALAAGVPVVASRNTPWAEVETMGSGLWVDNTPDAFARAIRELLARDLGHLRAKARDHAVRYDLTSIAAAFRKTYAELIDGG